MDHSPIVHIDQPPGDVSKLRWPYNRQSQVEMGGLERETYKLQPIHIGMRLHKHIDVPILHPLRYHHKLILGHCHAHQR